MEYQIYICIALVIAFIVGYLVLDDKKRNKSKMMWIEFAGDEGLTMLSEVNSRYPSFEGSFQGYPVDARVNIESNGDDTYYYSLFTLTCRKPLKGFLQISSRISSRLVNTLSGQRDIPISDRQFSNNYVVSGDLDEATVEEILSPEIKNGFERTRSDVDKMFTGGGIGQLVAKGETITFKVRNIVSDKKIMRSCLELLVNLAKKCETTMQG